MSNKLAVKWGLIIAILLGSLYLIYPNYKWYSKPLAERETLDTLGYRGSEPTRRRAAQARTSEGGAGNDLRRGYQLV